MGYAALLYDRLTIDEAELLITANRRNLNLRRIFTKNPSSLTERELTDIDVVVNRCESKSRALAAARRVEELGITVVNSYRVEALCSDKIKTVKAFERGGVDVPKSLFKPFPSSRFNLEDWIAGVVKEAELKLGYPLIFKPTHGSWGKGIVKITNRRGLTEVLRANSKPTKINPEGVFLQEYVEKPGFDLRILVYKELSKSSLLCCMARVSRRPEEFRTNTHLGGLPVGVELGSYSKHINGVLKASDIILGEEDYGIIALDAMPQVEGGDWSIIHKLTSDCIPVYDEIRRFVYENRFKRYGEWKHEMELMFQRLKGRESYRMLRNTIENLLSNSRLKMHEANSRFDYAMNTRNTTGVNPADKYVDLCLRALR